MTASALRDAAALRIVTVEELAALAVRAFETANNLGFLLLRKRAVVQEGGFEGEGPVDVWILQQDDAVVSIEGLDLDVLEIVLVRRHLVTLGWLHLSLASARVWLLRHWLRRALRLW